MKQTAVEWLIDKHFGGIENCTPDFRKHIEQALEMEKEQLKEMYLKGIENYSEKFSKNETKNNR